MTTGAYDPDADQLVRTQNKPFHRNVPGPFYVGEGCLLCVVPETEAPTMISSPPGPVQGDTSCLVHRQPHSYDDVKIMIQAMAASCIECVRYRGTDPGVLRLLAEKKQSHLADALCCDS